MDEAKRSNIEPAKSRVRVYAPKVSVRAYMATLHLWSAQHAARRCSEVEKEAAGSGQFNYEHMAYASSAVMASVAFMEATINETLQDLADSDPDEVSSRCEGISISTARVLRELWLPPGRENAGFLEKSSILEKYRVTLAAAGAKPLDTGAAPYQSAKKLIELRNDLVHFKPQWQGDDQKKHKMEASLRTEFAGSTIFPGSVSPWYPTMCLGAGCAAWAHRSATALVDEWRKRIGLVMDYRDDLRELPKP